MSKTAYSPQKTDTQIGDIKNALRLAIRRELEELGAVGEGAAQGDGERALLSWFEPLGFELDNSSDTPDNAFVKNGVDTHVELKVILPHCYFESWLGQSGRELLLRAARLQLGERTSLVYCTPERGRIDRSLVSVKPRSGSGSTNAYESKFRQSSPAADRDMELISAPYNTRIMSTNPGLLGKKNTELDAFLVNDVNRFVLNILEKGARGEMTHNPLLLRGACGTGKTLLLKIMASLYGKLGSTGFVYLLPARDFAFLLRHDAPFQNSFRHGLRHCAAFCLDDAQQLQPYPRAQQELAALLEYLHALNIPVLISASLPGDSKGQDPLSALQPALFSRLCMGIVLDLAEPDIDIKMRYAQALLSGHSLNGQRDLALALARRCSGFRQIQGTVSRIDAFRAYSGQLPDERDLDIILRSSGNTGQITPEAVLALVAARCGFTAKDLRGKKRYPELVEARQLAMFLCRELLGESYPALGKIFGNKDHSTVIHAVKKIKKMQIENKDMHNLVTELTQSCRKGSG